jgi:hypothetical protein
MAEPFLGRFDPAGLSVNQLGNRQAKEFDVERAVELRKSGLSWRKLASSTGMPVHLLRNRLASARRNGG